MSEKSAKRQREAKALTPIQIIARAGRFVAANGRFPTSREDQVLHRKLNEMRAKRGKLAPAVAAGLEKIPGWSWADAERPAELTARRLAAFLAENDGRYPGNTRTTPKEEVNLNKVLSKYRRAYASMPAEDRASFERVPGWSWAIAEKPAIGAKAPLSKKPAPSRKPAASAAAKPSASRKPAAKAKRRASRSPNDSAAAPAKLAKLPSRSPSYDPDMLVFSPSPELPRSLHTDDLPPIGAYERRFGSKSTTARSLQTDDLPPISAYSRLSGSRTATATASWPRADDMLLFRSNSQKNSVPKGSRTR
jgi:hypothetical protein